MGTTVCASVAEADFFREQSAVSNQHSVTEHFGAEKGGARSSRVLMFVSWAVELEE
jgi:hypothetical protein